MFQSCCISAMDERYQDSRTLGKTASTTGKPNTSGAAAKRRILSENDMPSFLQACENCDEDVIRWYLAHGVSNEELNRKDKTGKTGLAHASSNGFLNIVSLLRRANVDVNVADNEGNTPLIFAAQAGHSDIVRLLLNGFGNLEIDKRNRQGFTALMKAAVQGRSSCAKILLLAGASPQKRDFGKGLSTMQWAEYCNRQSCVKVIKQFVDYKVTTKSQSLESPESQDGSNDIFRTTVFPCDEPEIGCAPLKFVRNFKLPSSSVSDKAKAVEKAQNSPHLLQQNMENIVRCFSAPVIPDCMHNAFTLLTPVAERQRNKLVVPRVEVTVTSMDDNYWIESNCHPITNHRYIQYLVDYP